RGCGYCDLENVESLDRKIVQFVQEQVMIVNTALVHNGQYMTLHPASVYLKVAAFTAMATADDLAQNIFASRFACVIVDLRFLAQEIHRYMNSADPRFIAYVVSQVDDLAGRIDSAHCGSSF